MNVEQIREYCLSKSGSEECLPFDYETLVFKVSGKMFILISLDGALSINVKCNPDKAIVLREHYPQVLPGYHMNKKHWNTIYIDGSVASDIIYSWIDHSYDLVVEGLSRKQRERLPKK